MEDEEEHGEEEGRGGEDKGEEEEEGEEDKKRSWRGRSHCSKQFNCTMIPFSVGIP